MSEEAARARLAELARTLAKANAAYHRDDAPEITDAEYDALKRENAQIEAAFPHLKRADSPSDQVGAAPSGAFSKITHAERMLSLGNAFTDADVAEFTRSVRKIGRAHV